MSSFRRDKAIMKRLILITLVLTLFCTISYAQSAEPTFVEYRLKDVGTIQIPAIMELQGGEYKQISDSFSKQMGFEISGDDIIFQQKGLNDFDFKNNKTYARVMIGTEHVEPGTVERLTKRIVTTPAELREVNELMKQGLVKSFEGTQLKLIRWDGVSITNVNGRNALKTAYLRQLNSNPSVYVELYLFQNYDRTHRLTISYRLEDSAMWNPALERTKNSFTITNVR